VRSLIAVPSDANLSGSSFPRFSNWIVMHFVGQILAHWPQPVQSSILLKRRALDRSGIFHLCVGYCRVTDRENRWRQATCIESSTVKIPSQIFLK
jgi:hypothetical protein